MPVTPTYPGLYIQELPSNTHTVTAAPTSIAAFIGYVDPWATDPSLFSPVGGVAVPISSFTDYEAQFGGFFTSGLVDSSLPRAVYQFFVNGGSMAYVVGLKPMYRDSSGNPIPNADDSAAFIVDIPTIPASDPQNGMRFTAQKFADQVPMGLIISNLRSAPNTPGVLNLFDLSITYGSTIETYRGVALGDAATATPNNAPDKLLNPQPDGSRGSSLVRVAPLVLPPPPPPGSSSVPFFGAGLPVPPPSAAGAYPFTCDALTKLLATPPPTDPGPLVDFRTTFAASDFINAMQSNTSLDQVEIFNLLLTPGVSDNSVQSAALAFAERKLAFALLDPPQTALLAGTPNGIDQFAETMPRSQNGAVYFPWLMSTDPITSKPVAVAPSGFVAGICARTDVARGVWKAPAGLAATILNTVGPVNGGVVTDAQAGELNGVKSVNCLRPFAATGTVVFGARTLVGNNPAYAQSRYVPVRRMTLFLEQTLLANLRWVVFEPNDDPLWTAIRLSIESFMLGLWTQGALQGSTPAAAFQVKCDSSTTTPDDQQNGIVNIVVAFAPLKPAEFVIIKIAQLAGQPTS
jgi:phage tail sheath protein FI